MTPKKIAQASAATNSLPAIGFVRLPQIIGDKITGKPAIIPISRSGWLAGVKSGRFPAAVRIGGVTAWRASDIQALVDRIDRGESV